MTGKLTIQEIAAVLVNKNGFEQDEAKRFVSEMFGLIQERLETEQIVKVKGLGTFKIVDVEARESVSVQTGERFVINSHAKVSFTPDATMKELVNRPFSQFETVVLNDGVEFSDMKEEAPLVEPEAQQLVEPETPQPVAHDEPQPVEENILQLAEVEGPQPEVEEEKPQSEVEEFVFDDDEERPWGRWILSALGVLALMALSAWGGYYYGTQSSQPAVTQVDTVVVHDTVTVAPVDTLAEVKEQLAEVPVTKPAEPVAAKSAEQPKTEQKKPASEPVDQYAAKDDRVRLGAYRIVGLDHEVKVLAGQTFYSICRAHLGPDMECYVEVFNNLPKDPKVKEGQVIKIPKLQLKKKRKQ